MPPARTHLLRGRGARIGPLLQPGEDVLELHHAGIGEHQRRVVARHQRARGHDLVAVLPEIVEKCRPDLVYATHDCCLFEYRRSRRKLACSSEGCTGLLAGTLHRCPETWNCANPCRFQKRNHRRLEGQRSQREYCRPRLLKHRATDRYRRTRAGGLHRHRIACRSTAASSSAVVLSRRRHFPGTSRRSARHSA